MKVKITLVKEIREQDVSIQVIELFHFYVKQKNKLMYIELICYHGDWQLSCDVSCSNASVVSKRSLLVEVGHSTILC